MSNILIPYLPSIEWYGAYAAHKLCGTAAPVLPRHFCRAKVIAPFGERTLSVPVEGGRRLITASRYDRLLLSEHGNWRHTHWSTIASAYGSTPFFHFYENELHRIYSQRFERLSDLCFSLHAFFDHAVSLTSVLDWLKSHPTAELNGSPQICDDISLSMLHLLCEAGPASIFTLLKHNLISLETKH